MAHFFIISNDVVETELLGAETFDWSRADP
jgi:hypothetical protein